jgi:propanol-preferring alcohol dehydrogenase
MTLMKAAVVHTFGQPLQIEEVPVPEVTPGQVLVKVVASGVCHTDLHAADGDWPVKPTLPFIPGHEGVGFVAALGQGVRASRKATASACRGCTPPAATASTASPAGKRCATSSR